MPCVFQISASFQVRRGLSSVKLFFAVLTSACNKMLKFLCEYFLGAKLFCVLFGSVRLKDYNQKKSSKLPTWAGDYYLLRCFDVLVKDGIGRKSSFDVFTPTQI